MGIYYKPCTGNVAREYHIAQLERANCLKTVQNSWTMVNCRAGLDFGVVRAFKDTWQVSGGTRTSLSAFPAVGMRGVSGICVSHACLESSASVREQEHAGQRVCPFPRSFIFLSFFDFLVIFPFFPNKKYYLGSWKKFIL